MFFVSAALFAAETQKELTHSEVEKIGAKAVRKLNTMLKTKIKDAKRKGGVRAIADFCINNSVEAIEKLDKELGDNIKIKRVSLKNRNPKAYPEENEIKILKAFELIQKSDAYLPKSIVQVIDEKTYKVYSPIVMKSRTCKKCHGPEKTIKKELKELFAKKYPNDKAYGYKSGEIRGAIVVTIMEK